MSDHRRIIGRDVMLAIATALDIPTDNLRRIVLDVPYDNAAVVYTEQIGDDRLLEISWVKFKPMLKVKGVGDWR